MKKIIQTERLLLRPLGMEDLHTTHAYVGDKEHVKYMRYLPTDSLEETKDFLLGIAAEWQKEYPQFFEFAMTLGEKNIGSVSVYLDETGEEGELGWILHSDYCGSGYATEAAKAVMAFAVNELKVKRLVAHCDARNEASYRVMEKIGLRLERDDDIRYNKGAQQPAQGLLYSMTITES